MTQQRKRSSIQAMSQCSARQGNDDKKGLREPKLPKPKSISRQQWWYKVGSISSRKQWAEKTKQQMVNAGAYFEIMPTCFFS
mmetsp:Transcript_53425/g.124393  ORF Transcript_53425/g.124393 Transcript_53425/m.124393 type:complete len:82 (-) Transcript_53425:1068-1313(-)